MPFAKIDFSQTSLSEKGKLLKPKPRYDIQKDGKVSRIPSCIKVLRYQEPVIHVRQLMSDKQDAALQFCSYSVLALLRTESSLGPRSHWTASWLLSVLHSSAGFYKTSEAGLGPWRAVIMLYQLLTILEGINVVSSSQPGLWITGDGLPG